MIWKTITFFTLYLALTFTVSGRSSVLNLQEHPVTSRRDTAHVNALNKASWSNRRSNTSLALAYGKQAAELSNQIRYWPGMAYAYKNLGTVYYIKGDYAQARSYYDKALQQFREQNNRMETGNIHNSYGLLYWELGDYDKAVLHYDQANKIFARIGDREGQGIVLSNLGIIYYEVGQFDKALGNYSKALTISEQLSDEMTCANIHPNIGLVYKELENFEKALLHLNASLKIEEKNGNISGKAKSFTNIGVCYFEMGNMDSSLVYHQRAMPLYKKLGELKGVSQSLINIGSIYSKRNDFTAAGTYFEQALRMKRELKEKQGEAIVLIHLGGIRLKEDRLREAVGCLDLAYELSSRLKSLKYQAVSAFLLAQVYEKLHDESKAMRFYKIYVASNDSLMREKANHKLTNIQVSFETRDKQKKIAELEKKGLANSRKKLLAVTGGIVVMLVALFWFLRQRKKHAEEKLVINEKLARETSRQRTLSREKEALASELDEHRSSLLAYTRTLMERNEQLGMLQEKLNKTKVTGENEERIGELNALSRSRIVTDDDWEEFKVRYNKVFPGFMFRMKEKHPAITPAELRLAALIRLKLSSREIAAVLGISADSVKKARQRLRKKLHLETEIGLEEALVNF